MHEQSSGQTYNTDPIAEALRPYEDLAQNYIAVHAALDNQSPEAFSGALSLARNKDAALRSPNENVHLDTLSKIAAIGNEVATSDSTEAKLQPWHQDYLAAVEASIGVDRTFVELGDGSLSQNALTTTLSELSIDRTKQASEATNPDERSRLMKEAQELKRFVSMRDNSSPEDNEMREQAANRYYESHKLSGKNDREGVGPVIDQINHDVFFAKYVPEAAARIRSSEQGQSRVEARGEEEVMHEQDLIEKANKIVGARMTPARKERLENEYWSLQGTIQEERRRGVVNGPASQKSRKIMEIEMDSVFKTKLPEDIPKMFDLLGLKSDEMKAKADSLAQDLRETIQKVEPGYVASVSIGFSVNEKTGQLQTGLGHVGITTEDVYIDKM